MATIITREVGATAKGSPLTNAELDNNFINLNADISSAVVGPGSATDNALVRFNGLTGKLTKNSVVTLTDDGQLDGLVGLTSDQINIPANYSAVNFAPNLDITGWNYSGSSYPIGSQETAPTGLFFKPDGLKMYVCGTSGDDVNEYAVSAEGALFTTTFTTTFSVAAQDTAPADIFFKPDGLTFYILGDTNNAVFQYTLTTAWDITTASYANKTFSVAGQETTPTSIWFRPNGLEMYVIGQLNDTIYKYTLTTAWDVSTASYSGISFNISSRETAPVSLQFSADGTQMYVLGTSGDDISQWTLSTSWDITTAYTFVGTTYVGFEESVPSAMYITDFAVYVVGSNTDTIYQYNAFVNTVALKVFGQNTLFNGNIRTEKNAYIDGSANIDGFLTVGSTLTTGGSIVSGGNITGNQISTSSSAITLGGSISTGNTTITSGQSSGLITIGGTAATGDITLGRSTAAQTLNLGTGATAAATTKTVNVGTDGLSGSTTNINIGSTFGTAVTANGTWTYSSPISGSITGTAANVTGIVAVANGGTGTATPGLVQGNNITITGTWPNQTIAASGGGGGVSTISNKTSAYTVVAGDLGTIINCTSGTFTVSLTAAATLGAGFNVTIWNTSSNFAHEITIDPAGNGENIEGLPSIVLRSNEGTQIICDGTNWRTGAGKELQAYAESRGDGSRPSATGYNSVAIGYTSQASGVSSIALGNGQASASNTIAIGPSAQATNSQAVAIGINSSASGSGTLAIGQNSSALSTNATAIGQNSAGQGAQAVTGAGAMALGGSYASGASSFAAAVGDNTNSYGAIGSNAVAIGYLTRAGGNFSLALGRMSQASGTDSLAIGLDALASGNNSTAIGHGAIAQQYGKFAFASGYFSFRDAQNGMLVIRRATTSETPVVLTSDGLAPGSTNQLILPNNSVYVFTGTIIARQQAASGNNFAAWEIKGGIMRAANAASTVLGSFNINTLSKTAGATAWTIALSADTVNGGLAVTVTGAAATNIRWVATVTTSEATFA